jgi:glycerophosphoryl diester phosphodiesterase
MDKTLNIAHRGFTKGAPANTLEAFYAAVRLGIDAVECDVQETADHHFVIYHDNEINCKNINDLPLREIRKILVAEHYQIPTLEETLIQSHNHIKVMLELKQVQSLELLLEIVTAEMKTPEVFITSFSTGLVKSLADFAPQMPRGILLNEAVEEPLKLITSTRARIMLPRFTFTDAKLVNTLHEHNILIMVWDCNAVQDMRKALDWGVDGIITDSSAGLALEIANRKRLQK